MTKLIDKGYIHIYTGLGKGKTTAALGLAMRAAGHGHKTFIGQFMKGVKYGEVTFAETLGGQIFIERFGEDSLVHPDAPREEDKARAREGLKRTEEAMLSGDYQIIVLDEINVTVAFGLMEEKPVLALLDKKPDGVELVLTGIRAPQSFIDKADLVTEMKEVRHYFKEKGILARDGIER